MPPPASRPWVLSATAAYSTALAISYWPGALYLVPVLVLGLAIRLHPVTAAIVTAAALTASLGTTPLEPVAAGPVDGDGVMATDVIEGRYGPYGLIELESGVVLADLPPGSEAQRGDRVRIQGTAEGAPGTIAGRRHRGTVKVRVLEVVGGPSSPVLALGNSIRDRVSTRLAPLEGGRALLAGFLVGDTTGVDEIDQEAMRRAGLSHYTAVSGSNVALFLSVLFIAMGPIGVGPRRRAVVGLLGLPVFAAATRFEPSVLRASVMAGLGLAGRLVGVEMEAWQVLSTAVIGLILMDPLLATSVAFQLSVAAAAGVMVGARWPLRKARSLRPVAVAIGAQVSVAPLLVLHFGLVPLLSPLANVIAAPVVALSTVLGVLGMLGPGLLASVGAALAGTVLSLARLAAGWPQLGWRGLLISVAALALFVALPRLRGAVVISAGVAAAILVAGQTTRVPEPGVVVLDVGQGDAILISGGEGHFALVDGGPDPVRLFTGLRRYGIRHLELVILTHVHADHAAGLTGLVGRIPIDRVWADPEPHRTASSEELFRLLESSGVPVERPEPGDRLAFGELLLDVKGPLRRYASPNDQSVVLMVTGPARSMLLSGDIEAVAQAELTDLRADVLKVPHHGAATSDPEWLDAVGSDLSVIPVGENDFGHPSDLVVATLEESGDKVLRTDLVGDVAVPLG